MAKTGNFFGEEWFDKSSLNFGVIPLFKKKAIAPLYMILHKFLRVFGQDFRAGFLRW